jgi:hypothetical protein
MNLRGNLTYSQVSGYLLIQLASSYQKHHLLLAGGQRREGFLNLRQVAFGCPPLPVTFDRGQHGVDHLLVTEGLRKKVDCTSLHGADRHRNIAISRHYYHGKANAPLVELGVERKSIHIGQSNIDNDAPRRISEARAENSRAVP